MDPRPEVFVFELGLEIVQNIELGVHGRYRKVSSEPAGSIRFMIPSSVVR
jgi:hypothetical protein